MKKKIMGWFTAFALVFILGLVTFNESASASTIEDESMINSTNATMGEWEESFRFESSWFSKNGKFLVHVDNNSFEGGEYMVRLYKKGTTKVLFERSGYIEPKSTIKHDFYELSMKFSADAVWYRKSGSNVEILGMVYANRD